MVIRSIQWNEILSSSPNLFLFFISDRSTYRSVSKHSAICFLYRNFSSNVYLQFLIKNLRVFFLEPKITWNLRKFPIHFFSYTSYTYHPTYPTYHPINHIILHILHILHIILHILHILHHPTYHPIDIIYKKIKRQKWQSTNVNFQIFMVYYSHFIWLNFHTSFFWSLCTIQSLKSSNPHKTSGLFFSLFL